MALRRQICIDAGPPYRDAFRVVEAPQNGNGSQARRIRGKRGGAREAAPDDPTPNDNLLYLLFELERAIARRTIVWSADLAAGVQRRLERLARAVRQIAVDDDCRRPIPEDGARVTWSLLAIAQLQIMQRIGRR